jgi:glycosyltransferase involved in cell wall biosynthesis
MLPHAIITTGEAVKRLFINGHGVDEAKVFSIPTGVEERFFCTPSGSEATRSGLGLSTKDFVVGTVGFIRYEKGLNYFVEAAELVLQQYPDLKFLIVGDGPEERNLKRSITERGLSHSIVLTGFRKDVPEILMMMDIFVLSSREEGLPQTLSQALAMQRPVVATDVGSVSELVRHGCTGLLVPPRDAKALAEGICILRRDRAFRETLGRAGRELIAESYGKESMLDQTENLYARLLKKWSPSDSS